MLFASSYINTITKESLTLSAGFLFRVGAAARQPSIYDIYDTYVRASMLFDTLYYDYRFLIYYTYGQVRIYYVSCCFVRTKLLSTTVTDTPYALVRIPGIALKVRIVPS